MKKREWPAIYGWPASTIIIFFSLLGWLFVLLNKQSAPHGPLAKTAVIRYAPPGNTAKAEPGEAAQIRAVYASDLFASARGNRFSAAPSPANSSLQPQLPLPFGAPPFLSLPPETGKADETINTIGGRFINIDEIDSPISHRPFTRATGPSNKTPLLSIALTGDLKRFSIEPDAFQGLPLAAETPSAGKVWTIRAELSVNNEGRIEHVLAESQDCGPDLYQAVVKRLYQCRFNNVRQACRGEIIISYPLYCRQPE